jgi:hypothetical protein
MADDVLSLKIAIQYCMASGTTKLALAPMAQYKH